MTTEQITQKLQESLVSVNNILKYAKENDVQITLYIQRKACTTVDIVEQIQLSKIAVVKEQTFDSDDNKVGKW